MAVNNNYPTITKPPSAAYDFLKDVREIIRNIMNGRTNNTGEVTLTHSATSTVVPNILCNANSAIILQPITADASGLASVYVVAGDKEITIHHASNSSTNLVFRYVIVG